MKKGIFLVFVVLIMPYLVQAQSKQRLNIEGDFYYDSENYIEAEDFYQKSVNKKKDFQSLYNLGNSQEKQPKIEEALANYGEAMNYANTDDHRAMTHYNTANTMFSDQEGLDMETLEKIIGHYKDAIKLNPTHDPARHNLASAQIALDMAKKQQEQEQQQQQEDQQNQNEEQENQDQQDQQDQENSDDQDQQEQKPNQDQQKPSEDEMKQQKQNVDKNEIENILKMVEKEDGEVQQKMRKQTTSDTKAKKKRW